MKQNAKNKTATQIHLFSFMVVYSIKKKTTKLFACKSYSNVKWRSDISFGVYCTCIIRIADLKLEQLAVESDAVHTTNIHKKKKTNC